MLRKLFQRCCDVMMRLTELLLFVVMAIITFEVVSRYIFKSPTLWVVDVSRYCLVYITFLAATSLLLKGEHINVDLVLTHTGPRTRLAFNIIGHLLCSIAFLVFFIFTAAATWDHYERGILVMDPIEIPKFIPLAIIPVGGLFLFLGSIFRIGDFIGEWRTLRAKAGR